MSTLSLVSLLEQVRDMLGVEQDGPGTQKKPAQKNASSESAAKAKLRELYAKQKQGRSASTKVQAHGAARRR